MKIEQKGTFFWLQAKVEQKGINPSVLLVFISTWNISFCAREKAEQKGTIVFASGKKLEQKRTFIDIRAKVERKGTFLFVLET
jgi:restriction endonuclease Mrr